MDLIYKHLVSFTCLLSACLLKLFSLGPVWTSLDGRQKCKVGARSTDKKQTLCAGWLKNPPAKKLSKRNKVWSITSLIQGQCHFAMGEGILCIAGKVLPGMSPQTCSQR